MTGFYLDQESQADLCRDFFCSAVGLELSFFEAAYTTSVSAADPRHRSAGINDSWKICEGTDGPFAGSMVRSRVTAFLRHFHAEI